MLLPFSVPPPFSGFLPLARCLYFISFSVIQRLFALFFYGLAYGA